jgi:hypothetical protein
MWKCSAATTAQDPMQIANTLSAIRERLSLREIEGGFWISRRTARELFVRVPDIKKQLWDGYFIASKWSSFRHQTQVIQRLYPRP